MALSTRKLKLEADTRRMKDLISVGPAILHDFELLGVRGVTQLARSNPRQLYRRLCLVTGEHQGPCVLDVFCAAVAQARDPHLPAERCLWWYWSRKRKAQRGSR